MVGLILKAKMTKINKFYFYKIAFFHSLYLFDAVTLMKLNKLDGFIQTDGE